MCPKTSRANPLLATDSIHGSTFYDPGLRSLPVRRLPAYILTSMDSARRASRRSVDYPKPESDLAEWATKIKALQRQVDADEEAEQKRLEAEIVAARQARLRRSRQFSRPSKLEDTACEFIAAIVRVHSILISFQQRSLNNGTLEAQRHKCPLSIDMTGPYTKAMR